jgi:hypothetical protein
MKTPVTLAVLTATLAVAQTTVRFSKLNVRPAAEVRNAGTKVIRTADEWKSFLGGGAAAVPRIDFNRSMVVAIFAGEKPTGGYSVVVDRVTSNGSTVTVHYHVAGPPRDAMTIQALTYPFCLIRIDQRFSEVSFSPPVNSSK